MAEVDRVRDGRLGRCQVDVVDFDYLVTYADSDMAVVAEVLSLFCEQGALWLRVLDPQEPGVGWRDGVHSLKGAALGIGAMRLADACSEAEKGSTRPDWDRNLALSRVREALSVALAEVEAYQKARAA